MALHLTQAAALGNSRDGMRYLGGVVALNPRHVRLSGLYLRHDSKSCLFKIETCILLSIKADILLYDADS